MSVSEYQTPTTAKWNAAIINAVHSSMMEWLASSIQAERVNPPGSMAASGRLFFHRDARTAQFEEIKWHDRADALLSLCFEAEAFVSGSLSAASEDAWSGREDEDESHHTKGCRLSLQPSLFFLIISRSSVSRLIHSTHTCCNGVSVSICQWHFLRSNMIWWDFSE